MNIALVVAGGVGARTNNHIPKQFLTIYDKPIIVYTLENLMRAQCFDQIFVVLNPGWSDFVDSYAKQFDITAYCGNIASGETRFQSVLNGFKYLMENGYSESTVAVVDANRPLIPSRVFNEAIALSKTCDCVVGLEPCYDSMMVADSDTHIVISAADRSTLFKGQGPEVCKVKEGYDVLSGFSDFPANASIVGSMLLKNKQVKYVAGSPLGFKITTAEDITIFRAMIDGTQR